MRKLMLDLEDLDVESFETHPVSRRVGTVRAHETGMNPCYTVTMAPEITCNAWGCNQEETVGLSCGCYSMECTNDPLAIECLATVQFTCVLQCETNRCSQLPC